jgi:hypothetical protein
MGFMAQSITASKTDASEFPMVRVSHFELLGRHAREATGSSSILWAPFVTERQRPEWSSFCYREQDWYNESLTIFRSDPGVVHISRNRSMPEEFREYIWEGEDLENVAATNGSGPFAPLWHISPPPSSSMPINYNVLQEKYIQDVLPSFDLTSDSVLTSAQYSKVHDFWSWIAPPTQELFSEERNDPFSTHVTPVFERLNDANSPLVGVLLSKMIWMDFISRLFTDDDHGIVVLLQNTCNQSYTYTINAGEVRFPREFGSTPTGLLKQQLTSHHC